MHTERLIPDDTFAQLMERLQHYADQRVDPVEDAEVCDFLLQHPELLERFADLRQMGVLLASDQPQDVVRSTRSNAWPNVRRRGLVAAALILVLAGSFLLTRSAPPEPESDRARPILSAGTGRVVDASFTTVHEDSQSVREVQTYSVDGRRGHRFESTTLAAVEGNSAQPQIPATFLTREILR